MIRSVQEPVNKETILEDTLIEWLHLINQKEIVKAALLFEKLKTMRMQVKLNDKCAVFYSLIHSKFLSLEEEVRHLFDSQKENNSQKNTEHTEKYLLNYITAQKYRTLGKYSLAMYYYQLAEEEIAFIEDKVEKQFFLLEMHHFYRSQNMGRLAEKYISSIEKHENIQRLSM